MRWALTLISFALGCGPIQSSTLIVDAQAELAAAKTAQADQHAQFEYVAAEEYLHKAREEQSYADFQIAALYAEKSRDCARLARSRAEAITREGLGATRATHATKAKCRPGPERMIPIPDPAEEAATMKARPVIERKKKEATPPPKGGKKRAPVKPNEPAEPLPEGDDE